MSKLSARAARVFYMAWMANNQPTMTVVDPVTAWELPRGYTYDHAVDNVVDGQGHVLADPSPYWHETTVRVIPMESVEESFNIGPAGISPDGSSAVIILPGDVSAVKHANRVCLGENWFNVVDVRTEPAGALTPTWAIVRLRRRS